MPKDNPVVIVGCARTPMGAFLGDFKDLAAPVLGATAIRAAVQRAKVSADDIEEIVMGCVLPAGQGQAPARQAGLGAGLPLSAGATTINKMCGSGMKAVMQAADSIRAGNVSVAVAGGMESMSNAPYLLEKARTGYRMGHGAVRDHMFHDGLEDVYDKGRLMGTFAEECAESYQFTRKAQDDYARSSLSRALAAAKASRFDWEIAPVAVESRDGAQMIRADEQPPKAKPDKIPALKPAFRKDGTVTAANSSSISDGAAALVLMTLRQAERRNLEPIATICGQATHAQAPNLFTTAPIGAIEKLLTKTRWSKDSVDLFEINEAFAVVAMAAMRDLEIDHAKTNVHGGACALGHPIGASGARIIVTLIGALRTRKLKRGIASLCIGGGEATAVGVELI
jgi:acetyl-CoA C-acetyltransferase